MSVHKNRHESLQAGSQACGQWWKDMEHAEARNPATPRVSSSLFTNLEGSSDAEAPFCRSRALAAAYVKSFASKQLRFLTSSMANDQHNRRE